MRDGLRDHLPALLRRASSLCELVAVIPEDESLLDRIEQGSDLRWRWRLRGATSAPPGATRWAGVHAMYWVVRRDSGRRQALVVAHDLDVIDRHASISVAAVEPGVHGVPTIGGAALLIDELFRSLQLHKVSFQVNGYNAESLRSLARLVAAPEARLVDHTFARGRYWDQTIYSVLGTDWMAARSG